MNELLQRLDRDHFRLAFVLALIEGLLDEFHEGLEPDYVVMCQLMEYLIDYADQVHHPSEDLIFNRLLEQQGAQHALLNELMEQHRSLSQLNRRFKESIEGIVHGEVLRRDEVEHQGRELIDRLRRHMSLEDEKAFRTAHIAFGDNEGFPGGKSRSTMHMDYLIKQPTLEVSYPDGKTRVVMKDGDPV